MSDGIFPRAVQRHAEIYQNHLRQDAECQFEGIGHTGADGDKSIGIEQNGAVVGGAYQSGDVTGGYMSSSITPILLNVSEGDIFSLSISSGGSGTFEILGGRLTVEVVL